MLDSGWLLESLSYSVPGCKDGEVLKGITLEKSLIEPAAETASAESHPIVDRDYKKEIINVIKWRAFIWA